MSPRPRARRWKRRGQRNQRGAAYVELLIALLTTIFFFLAVWQVADACAAHLILKRAAQAAVRAAVVVMPDMGKFYDESDPNGGANTLNGARGEDVLSAARLVLVASPHFAGTESKVDISPQKPAGHEPVTAKVTANYQCFSGWVSLVCGATGSVSMTASATLPYQGVTYSY